MICKGRVVTEKGSPVVNAIINFNYDGVGSIGGEGGPAPPPILSNAEGQYFISIPEGASNGTVSCNVFGIPSNTAKVVTEGAHEHECRIQDLIIPVGDIEFRDENMNPTSIATADRRLVARLGTSIGKGAVGPLRWTVNPPAQTAPGDVFEVDMIVPHGAVRLQAEAVLTQSSTSYVAKNLSSQSGSPTPVPPPASTTVSSAIGVIPSPITMVGLAGKVALQEPVSIRLQRTASDPTLDQALWVAIRNRTRALSFTRYQDFMNRALRWEERAYDVPPGIQNSFTQDRIQRDLRELGTDLHGVRAYQTLKLLTETFLLLECGVRIERVGDRDRAPFDPGEESVRLGGQPFTLEAMEERLRGYLGDRAQLPYITRVVRAAFPEVEQSAWSERIIGARINEPCLIELIWSYWMEEGMLVQTMNAIAQRFQNVRGERDVLLNMEIDPLRPLNNLLWGFIQDEFNRLTVRRRAYEYVNHYGLNLYGRATAGMRPAESRSKFLEAFHNLLHQSSIFFKEDFQTTVIADGFPLLNALKEVHLILSQSGQNQSNDLPLTARAEMLVMQYMLSRREIRDFLQSGRMVPYKEPWEAQVDTMKTLQGWTDITVTHFRDLAVYGEQLLLAIRYGDWIAVNDEDSAKNWARYFRPEIQGYLHSYRAVTGIDLTNGDSIDSTVPGVLLQRRAAMQQRAR